MEYQFTILYTVVFFDYKYIYFYYHIVMYVMLLCLMELLNYT